MVEKNGGKSINLCLFQAKNQRISRGPMYIMITYFYHFISVYSASEKNFLSVFLKLELSILSEDIIRSF